MLHHYTTAHGLEGIINSRSIWASDFRFLNDSTEFNYGVKVFKKFFGNYKNLTTQPRSKALIDLISDRIEIFNREGDYSHPAVFVFVASFSEEPDLLSQWRGYNAGRGFSLGLNEQWIAENATKQGFHFTPVIYQEASQAEAVFNRLKVLNTTHLENGENEDQLHSLWESVVQIITAIKHPTFSEEKERRAVKVTLGLHSDVKVRSTPSGLVPYVPISLDNARALNPSNHPNNRGFEQIIIGPAFHPRQRLAVDALLSRHRMRFQILKSAVPYVAD